MLIDGSSRGETPFTQYKVFVRKGNTQQHSATIRMSRAIVYTRNSTKIFTLPLFTWSPNEPFRQPSKKQTTLVEF